MKKFLIFLLIFLCFSTDFKVHSLNNSAKASIVMNAETGEIIYQNNAHLRLPMASTTKIMTALILCENGDLQREITVTEQMIRVEGSSMGLLAGDRVTLHDLLYGMALASGNDAANVTAYVLGGTIDGFVKLMNQKAKEIGMNNTNFETPSGLDSKEHYSTAYDMALLTRYALQNEEFAKAVSCEKAILCYGNPPYRRSLTNHNKLLKSFEGAIGVKTGFTKKSGRCLVSAAEREGKKVIAVTLNDPDDWLDHTKMLEFGLNKIKITEISPPKTEYKIPVKNGDKEEIIINIEPLAIGVVNASDFDCNVELPQIIYAPVREGELLGNVIYKNGETVIKTVPVYSKTQIKEVKSGKSFFKILLVNVKCIFLKIWEN